ncbi:hypothetical protein RclHR1_05330002 [Rhizophagus clarus]|uniref:S-adenosyl-L-methionine-dependent methyltransferase n=1 Tax=Rhizophagus clarus TaxID=94130 RepID=A0A2Z6RSJ1_9GLOM|nr:hypothetical protein RclHR1_05330002 [Rhizophagus clarus]GES77819.1 S-adenosyl-L-methionine-dependent methyltransferase [Rhizophagus clarus]
MGKYFSKEFKLYNHHEIYSRSYESKDDYNEEQHCSHITMRDIFKGNFSSDIRDILSYSNTKILDIGCGFGFWLMEMASEFPKPNYFGIDVLPVFPTSTIPHNVKFSQHDLLKGLPYEDNTFDFVHIQCLTFDIPELYWETNIYNEIARILKPGGWLEICDMEFGIFNCGPVTRRFDLAYLNNLRSRKINPHLILRSHSILKSIPSFSSSQVHHKRSKYPLGSYENNLGKLCAKIMRYRIHAIIKGLVAKEMNIKRYEIDSTIDKIMNEFETNKSYYYIHRVYVQKNF